VARDFLWELVVCLLQLFSRPELIFRFFFSALTYKFASHLPNLLLDGLLNIPYFLISLRNSLLPVQPCRNPPPDLPPPVTAKQDKPATPSATKESQRHLSDTESNSDADIESNEGDTVDSSWVSLNKKPSEA